MSIRMRHTKGHTKNRRSHHALKETDFTTCEKCNAATRRHQMCSECGYYRGRQVVDVAAKKERSQNRKEEKRRAIGEVTGQQSSQSGAQEESKESDTESTTKPLSAEELSRK